MVVFSCASCDAVLTARVARVALPDHSGQKYGHDLLPGLLEPGTYVMDPGDGAVPTQPPPERPATAPMLRHREVRQGLPSPLHDHRHSSHSPAALGHAIREELISKNVAALTTLPSASKTKKKRQQVVWSVDEARRFLEHVHDDPLYAAYVLVLVLGLRRGEVLGLAWDCVDLDAEELHVARQLTRVGGQLLHRDKTKTDYSSASLPLLGLCVSALKLRRELQGQAREKASGKVEGLRLGVHHEIRDAHRTTKPQPRLRGPLQVRRCPAHPLP
ncbi:hypothetical protein [Nonomuraea sp. NPDC049758]|uniref:hypothetical protein n=1 Tax=Nonomuraea sp. NPDC049758 TaxID=3154360 RepID=UPI0034235BEB